MPYRVNAIMHDEHIWRTPVGSARAVLALMATPGTDGALTAEEAQTLIRRLVHTRAAFAFGPGASLRANAEHRQVLDRAVHHFCNPDWHHWDALTDGQRSSLLLHSVQYNIN